MRLKTARHFQSHDLSRWAGEHMDARVGFSVITTNANGLIQPTVHKIENMV